MRDLDPWMIYRGNPAEPVRNRPGFAERREEMMGEGRSSEQ
jgi:hypothetical protein